MECNSKKLMWLLQQYILLLQEVPFKVESCEKNLIAKEKQSKHRGETKLEMERKIFHQENKPVSGAS